MCIYITELLSKNLYSSEERNMLARANIISEAVSDNWSDYKFEITEGDSYNWLEDIVNGGVAGSAIRGILTDSSYMVIYDTNTDENLEGKVLMRDAIKSALGGKQAWMVLRSESGTKLMCAAVPIQVGDEYTGVVYLTASAEHIIAIINSVRKLNNYEYGFRKHRRS